MLKQGEPVRNAPLTLWERTLLLLLLSVGAALRFWQLGDKSLGGDEVAWADRFLSDGILYPATHLAQGQNHLGYTVPTRLLMEVLGRSDFALRFLPAALGVATLAVAWVLGRTLAGRLGGFGLTVLLAISFFPLAYARQARGYGGVVFFVTLAAYFLYAAWVHGGRSRWLGYIIGVVGSGYNHPYTALGIAGLGAWVLVQWLTASDRRAATRRFLHYLLASILALAILLALYSPGLSAYVSQASRTDLPEYTGYSVAGLLDLVTRLGPRLPEAGTAILLLLAAIGIIAHGREWRKLSLVILWFALPVLALWISRYFFTQRFLIFVAPPYLMLAVWGIIALGRLAARWRKEAATLVSVGVLSVLAAFGLYGIIPTLAPDETIYEDAPYLDWHGLSDYLKAHGAEEDVIAIPSRLWKEEMDAARVWYGLPLRTILLVQGTDMNGLNELLAQYDQPRRTWWLVTPPANVSPEAPGVTFGSLMLWQPAPEALNREQALSQSASVLEGLVTARKAHKDLCWTVYFVSRPLAAAYVELGKPAEAARAVKEIICRPASDWGSELLLARALSALGDPCGAAKALASAQSRNAPARELKRYDYLASDCPTESNHAAPPVISPQAADPYQYEGWRRIAGYIGAHGSEEDVLAIVTYTGQDEVIEAERWYGMPPRAVPLIGSEDGLEQFLAQYDKPRRTWWLLAPPAEMLPDAVIGTWGGLTLLSPSPQAVDRQGALAQSVQVLESLVQERIKIIGVRRAVYLMSRPLAVAYLELGKPDEALRVIKAVPYRPQDDWQSDIVLARVRAALKEPCNARFALESAEKRGAPADVLERYTFLTNGCPPRK
ncbi:MAG: glycosyltransferase family 39 protein [Anaerolineae bacterium]|nr:glycosyltransferase family 39 protein [Anaerolineae bacterium]